MEYTFRQYLQGYSYRLYLKCYSAYKRIFDKEYRDDLKRLKAQWRIAHQEIKRRLNLNEL